MSTHPCNAHVTWDEYPCRDEDEDGYMDEDCAEMEKIRKENKWHMEDLYSDAVSD